MPHFGMPRRIVETPASANTRINWRRGFFRIWLLASGAWIMSWVLWLMTVSYTHLTLPTNREV